MYIYYSTMLVNVVLRCIWFLSIAFTIPAEAWITISSYLELVRRLIWNLIRVENEHVCNVNQLKASKEINFKNTLEIFRFKIPGFHDKGHDQAAGKEEETNTVGSDDDD